MTRRVLALRAILAIAACAVIPGSSNAQRVTTALTAWQNSGRLREEPDRETRRRAVAADSSRRQVFFTRAVAGVAGWFVGAVAGGYIASVLPHHDCHCDDPGLDEALAGIIIGGVAGTAAGAALPSLGRFCGYGGRFGRGLLGSLAGTVIAAALTLPTFAPAAIVAIPVVSSSGAALAIGNC